MMRKNICLIIFIGFFVSGCANFQSNRWVENNTFYSTALPDIKITINKELNYGHTEQFFSTGEDALFGESVFTSKSNLYGFLDKDESQGIFINIETLRELDWKMLATNFSEVPHYLSSSKETLSGMDFYTGTFVLPNGSDSFLSKAYEMLYGDSTRFIVMYVERVGNEWLEDPATYSDQQREFLKEFSRRAKESFTVSNYDGTSPFKQ